MGMFLTHFLDAKLNRVESIGCENKTCLEIVFYNYIKIKKK